NSVPLETKATLVTSTCSFWRLASKRPDGRSHNSTFPCFVPAASVRPSGETARQRGGAPALSQGPVRGLLVARSQSRTVPIPPITRVWPSGEKDRKRTELA